MRLRQLAEAMADALRAAPYDVTREVLERCACPRWCDLQALIERMACDAPVLGLNACEIHRLLETVGLLAIRTTGSIPARIAWYAEPLMDDFGRASGVGRYEIGGARVCGVHG